MTNQHASTPTPNRRKRRNHERRVFLSMTSMFIIALLSGIGIAIWLSWTVFPLNPPVGSPAVFQDEFRRDYLYMISESLAQTGDWEQAKARLALLQADDLPQMAVLELENYLREGRSAEDVRHMARLAQRLGAQGTALDLFAPIAEQPFAELAPINTPTRSAAAGGSETLAPPTALPTLLPTPTPIIPPTSTPIPVEELVNSQLTYQLVSQEEVCITADSDDVPEIEIFVQDGAGDGVPGEEVLVSWESGVDRFVTGLKREVDVGYADFTMSADISYSAELVSGSNRVGGLIIGVCADEGQAGESSEGSGAGQTGWRLVFQAVE